MSTTALDLRCVACGSTASRFAYEKAGFDHRECGGCGTVFVYPVPDPGELAMIYDNVGEQESSVVWESSRRHLHAAWRRALDDIAAHAGHGRVLDVGCGTGQFVAFARQRGWSHACGLDVSEDAARIGRSRLGDDAIVTGSLGTAPLPAGSFAGITLWDVIEHLPDPRAAIAEIRRLLRPGGVLVMGTPHQRGVSMRVFGARCYVVMPPEHLVYFTATGIRHLLESEGMSVRGLVSEDIFLREWSKLVPNRRADDRDDDEARAYGAIYKRLTGSSVALAAFRIANRGLGMLRVGDQLYVTAQRRDEMS